MTISIITSLTSWVSRSAIVVIFQLFILNFHQYPTFWRILTTDKSDNVNYNLIRYSILNRMQENTRLTNEKSTYKRTIGGLRNDKSRCVPVLGKTPRSDYFPWQCGVWHNRCEEIGFGVLYKIWLGSNRRHQKFSLYPLSHPPAKIFSSNLHRSQKWPRSSRNSLISANPRKIGSPA